jgi:pimeloyl-ACP methyl ester carboxylesterase
MNAPVSPALRGIRAIAVAACAAFLVLSPMPARPQGEANRTPAPAAAKGPLVIAKQSFFYIGGHYDQTNPDHHVIGQVYVEYQIPQNLTHPFPIVMVHGGTATGLEWSGTPDGREGWEQYFLRQGYAVYVVDQVGRGRSPYETPVYGKTTSQTTQYILERFTASERFNLWPQAHLHTQWPGKAQQGDPSYDSYASSNMASMDDRDAQDAMNVHALDLLLDRLGPSILFVHSQAGQYAWPLAQDRPALVKAIVAVEPAGPPVHDVVLRGGEPRFGVVFEASTKQDDQKDQFRDSPQLKTYGLTNHVLAYMPAVSAQSPLQFVRQEKADGTDLARCWRQKEPAKKLAAIGDRPIVYIAAEASFFAPYSHCTVAFLEQAGVHVDFIKLADIGIRGNGHLMMLEKNSDQIAQVVAAWLDKALEKANAVPRNALPNGRS